MKQHELDQINYDQHVEEQTECECCGAHLTDIEQQKYESICENCMFEQTGGLLEGEDIIEELNFEDEDTRSFAD